MQLLSRRATWRIASVTLLLTVLVIACSAVQTYPHAEPVVATHQSFDYQRDIRPILETRCMACHGCYDAPCQLKLTSAEGIERGASKKQVYDGTRIDDAEPTRLGIDADSTEAWR